MSIRKLFDKQIPQSIVSSTNMEDLGKSVESSGNIQQRIIQKNRFIPQKNYADPKSFAKFGSAEKYYSDSFDRIANQYPYDGSLQERTEYLNNSTYLDLYVFDNVYPRTTGYATISPNGWGTTTDFVVLGPGISAGKPSIIEYIQVIGGPHTASGGMIGKELSNTFENSNFYDPAKNRESNLRFNLDPGMTMEFWMFKQSGSLMTGSTDLEVPVMLSNDVSGTAGVGMFTDPAFPVRMFFFVISGSTTADTNAVGGFPVTDDQIFDGKWHHYAFAAKNTGSSVNIKGYFDGNLVYDEDIAGGAISEVTGALKLNVGAARKGHLGAATFPSDGYGKLSGSIDEFRYWKTQRTSEEIGRNWFTQIGGGTNHDDANTDLGVYLKFNEGITGTSSVDSIALDYSGRISNGKWVGYTQAGRSTGSAIDEYFDTESEFKDPIIYSFNPEVSSLKELWSSSGSAYDITNNSSIYTSIPSWITEEDIVDGGLTLQTLTQIISSYFDTLYLQIENLAHIKDKRYDPLTTKPLPFLDKILESHGFIAPEIFANADIIAQILRKDEEREFELDLTDIKNAIYKNIYNNLIYIFKSKGTDKAFRNLVRCFGVDEELIKINMYGDNVVYDFRDSYKTAAVRKKYADFNDPDRFDSTVYQQTASGNPNTLSYVPGVSSSFADYTAFTAEVEAVFPKKIEERNSAYFPTMFLTSSIYGFHTADTGTVELRWKSPDYDLQVSAIRFERESKDVYFNIQNTNGTINLTTEIFKDVYDNQKWNFAIRVFQDKYPNADLPSGSSDTAYTLEFYGVNALADYVAAEFMMTASIDAVTGSAFLNDAKRFYLGSHRTNFTGSTLTFSDAKISSLRYWTSYLDNYVMEAHARDPSNHGVKSPYGSTYLMQTSLTGVMVPQIETLAMNWDFDTVTSSDAGASGIPLASDAGYLVPDVSSGSLSLLGRYKWLGDVVNHQLTGRGDFYLANDIKVMDARYIHAGKQTLPEIVQASDTISALGESDLAFTRDTRPLRHFFGIEKSMYQTISEDMIKMFATIVDFNNLVGEPVNRYRQEYKNLEKLRYLYFEKVENEPDVEKFISFYKWIDQALGVMLQQLIPASAEFSDDIRNMVESHVLERNKYWTKFPTLEFTPVDPESGLIGINRHLYNWRVGHAPLNNLQNNNCYWWNARANRSGSVITSGDPEVDSNRQAYLDVTINTLNRSYTTPHRLKLNRSPVIRGGANTPENKKTNFVRSSISLGTSDGVNVDALSAATQLQDCDDVLVPNQKVKLKTPTENTPSGDYTSVYGKMSLPFDLFSSSVRTGYQASFGGLPVSVENYHEDVYGPDNERPMQGPFSETHVGGLQSRHVPLNDGSDDDTNRPEAFKVTFGPTSTLTSQDTDKPRATLYRDETAKRPLNIKNIKGVGGNYSHDYQVVMTSGRSVNNRAFVKYGGFSLIDPIDDSEESSWIPDMATLLGAEIDRNGTWGPNEYIIVERFSAPGGPDTMGDANGGPGLDKYAAEMSPNNDLNYRNRFVRDVLQDLQASHVNQFGFFSNAQQIPGAQGSTVNALNYAGTGSIYQVNRNTRYSYRLSGTATVKEAQYDNWYVQHQIPQSDFQYAWIKASYVSSPYCGYLPADGAPYSSSIGLTDAITFSSASDFVSVICIDNNTDWWIPTGSACFGSLVATPAWFGLDKANLGSCQINLPTVYMGLNYNVYEPINVDGCSNHLGYPVGQKTTPFNIDNLCLAGEGDYTPVWAYLNTWQNQDFLGVLGGWPFPSPLGYASLLNAIILKRNGPYGWPTWKQIRTAEHPVSRYFRENNQLVYNLSPGKTFENGTGAQITPRFSKCKKFDEPCVVSRYKPITQIMNEETNTALGVMKIEAQSSYANDLSFFSHGEVNLDLNLEPPARLAYDSIKDKYIQTPLINKSTGLKEFNFSLFDSVKYREIVFPASPNTFKKRNREREGYQNDFWRNSRSRRSALGKTKFGG